jgi:hypothetical protein
MTKEEITTIREAIQQKIDLVDLLEKQMAPSVEQGVIRDVTLHQYNLARDNFLAAWMKLDLGDLEKSVHHLMRGSWNLGEFTAMSKADRAASQ